LGEPSPTRATARSLRSPGKEPPMTVVSVRLEQDAVLLPIKSIVVDERNQVRLALSPENVERCRAKYESEKPGEPPAMPPILVADLGDGVLLLIDGFHRIRAQEQLGREEVLCTVIHCRDRAEAIWRGSSKNTTHGEPLKRKEMFRCFKVYVAAN